MQTIDWAPAHGREIGSEQLNEKPHPWRIVACLNVWNDCAALEQTLPLWRDHVDHIIAVDGAYPSAGSGLSTDGTREFLMNEGADVICRADCTQLDKRNSYFEACDENDLLVIIDADEIVTGAEKLREMSWLDVGWVRVNSPLYANAYNQPRVVRWQPEIEYRGRHHWIYQGDSLLCTHQYGGIGYDHRVVPVSIENRRGLGHSNDRGRAKRVHMSAQIQVETPAIAEAPRTTMSDSKISRREPLTIVQAGIIDAGMAPSRLHTAINRTTPHSSLWFKTEEGPFGVGAQYSTVDDRKLLKDAASQARVMHFHVHTMGIMARSHAKQMVVMHHHGTLLRRNAKGFAAEAKQRKALVLVSNLELLSHAPEAKFLPNTVPVARYRRLRSQHGSVYRKGDRFRVAHSPSKPEKKSTIEFQNACLQLHAAGYPIEPVIITGVSHREALTLKATCHAAFDSFWLGMQCSGIEAASMGMPVIAGDETCAERYVEHFGAVPYTFANTEEQLTDALARMMDDWQWYNDEAARVAAHVRDHHDESAVTLRYLDLLDERFGWR